MVNLINVLYPELLLLTLLLFADHISGLLASKKERIENPQNNEYGISSRKGYIGLIKKVGYLFFIFVAVCLDFIIYKFSSELGVLYTKKTFFGVLVTLWVIVNELISILENCARMGVKLPNNIKKVLADIESNISDKTNI